MRKPIKIFAPIAFVIVAALITLYIYNNHDASLAKIQTTKTIRIGYAVEAPHAFLNENNDVAGMSPEIAKYVANSLGAEKIEWKQTEFSMLFKELEAERVDVIAAGTFITPERARIVNFSEPIFHVRQGLLVAKGNPYKLNSYENFLQNKEVKVAVISGSVEQQFLKKAGVLEKQIVAVPDAATGRAAVENGNADCLALSSPTVNWMAIKDQLGKTEPAQPFNQFEISAENHSGFGAFAFRKEDKKLLNAWNAKLKEFMNTEDREKVFAKYGFTDSELPGNISTAEVLKK
ncbi:MAG TPA: ectoine/hydroxyectoine ABC transporter substrate-binding protein EhuB [Pyrinomonadaceae bacterium]|nr:ectoine/hydroxyectoine ABC transporter substrate-binding protein EhuB [Pyrinomonadaceae bacterium]